MFGGASLAFCPANRAVPIVGLDTLRADYLQLNRQIYARHEDDESVRIHLSSDNEIRAVEGKLHSIIKAAIITMLSSSTPTENDITSAVAAIQGEMALSGSDGGSEYTNSPFAQFFYLNGKQALVVAYVILQGGDVIPDTQPYIEFYSLEYGKWELKAAAGSDFRGSTFFVNHLNAGLAGENWYLVSGSRIGNPGVPLNLRLYAFDGNGVRVVWKRDDLPGGEVGVSNDSIVTLEYYKHYKSLERSHEVLSVTPDGLN